MWQEFIDRNKVSTYTTIASEEPILEMPERFDQLFRQKPIEKVSKVKEFFLIYLSLIQDNDVVVELIALIE